MPRRCNEDPDATTVQVRRALAGDPSGLEWVVARFSSALIAQARYRLGPVLSRIHEPEDVVHEMWLGALPNLASLAIEGRRATPVLLKFLSTILLRRINDLIRARIQTGDVGDPTGDRAADPADPVSEAMRRETVQLVLERIDKLAEVDRAVLVLRFVEQLTGDETAAELDIAVNTVYVRQHRALARLRRELPGSLFDDFDP